SRRYRERRQAVGRDRLGTDHAHHATAGVVELGLDGREPVESSSVRTVGGISMMSPRSQVVSCRWASPGCAPRRRRPRPAAHAAYLTESRQRTTFCAMGMLSVMSTTGTVLKLKKGTHGA